MRVRYDTVQHTEYQVCTAYYAIMYALHTHVQSYAHDGANFNLYIIDCILSIGHCQWLIDQSFQITLALSVQTVRYSTVKKKALVPEFWVQSTWHVHHIVTYNSKDHLWNCIIHSTSLKDVKTWNFGSSCHSCIICPYYHVMGYAILLLRCTETSYPKNVVPKLRKFWICC